jgi:hypothetical protein
LPRDLFNGYFLIFTLLKIKEKRISGDFVKPMEAGKMKNAYSNDNVSPKFKQLEFWL